MDTRSVFDSRCLLQCPCRLDDEIMLVRWHARLVTGQSQIIGISKAQLVMQRNSLKYREQLMEPVIPFAEDSQQPIYLGERGQCERRLHRLSIITAAAAAKRSGETVMVKRI